RAESASASCWNTLGLARCRAGDWKGGVAASERALELLPKDDPERRFVHLVLAMAHWGLKNKDRARTCYDQAVQRMRKTEPEGEVLRGLRAEVADLLGLKGKMD